MPELHPDVTMPRYVCHKTVHALKIGGIAEEIERGVLYPTLLPTDVQFRSIRVTHDWMMKHRPVAPGYYVVYEDGYTSWSPVEAFEKGYTPISIAVDINSDLPKPEPTALRIQRLRTRELLTTLVNVSKTLQAAVSFIDSKLEFCESVPSVGQATVMGEGQSMSYTKLPLDCDMARTSFAEAAQIVGPAFSYNLYVSSRYVAYARTLSAELLAAHRGNPFAPYLNVLVEDSLSAEWVLEANGKRAGSRMV